jgi:hypothetical protein
MSKKKRKIRRAKKKSAAQTSSAINFQPGIPNVQPAPVSRKALRLRQLQEGQAERMQGQELAYEQVDPEADTRRDYQTQVEQSHAPLNLGPQFQKRKPYTTALPDVDISHDPDLLRNANLHKIAALPVEDQSLIAVDNAITSATASIQNLLTAAKGSANRSAGEHDELGRISQDNAQRIVMITGEAILPWIREIEDHMEEILKSSQEGNFILQSEQLEQEPLPPEGV